MIRLTRLVIVGLALLLLFSQGGQTAFDSADAPEDAISPVPHISKVDGWLTYEMWKSSFDVGSSPTAKATIRFDHVLAMDDVERLETLGLEFRRFDGEVAHIGSIYVANIPLSTLGTLAEEPGIIQIEGEGRTAVPLDLSVPEVRADEVWNVTDGLGRNVLGTDVLIANFDTGVDVYHPDLWFADGGDYSWIDVDGNGSFDSGIDAVDLNGNMIADPGEVLSFYDSHTYDWWDNIRENNDGIFQLNVDWLYNDRNDDGTRDYGPDHGFDESDPTFGEQIFIVNNTNNNTILDVSDTLTALGTSKIRATYGFDGTRTRGVDLILSTNDTRGHGTGVAGIALGGTPGSRRYVGVAPGAELLSANRYENPLATCMLWANTQGADVLLYELGGWIGYFMDGSSNIETMMDSLADDGMIQVVPAGNLAGSWKHMLETLPASSVIDFPFWVESGLYDVYMTMLWRTVPNDLVFRVESPSGYWGVLPLNGGSIYFPDGHEIWSWRSNSTRGTAKAEIWIDNWNGTDYVPVESGVWTLRITNTDSQPEVVDGYISDDVYSWSGGASWLSSVSDERTVTWPATADSAIVVGSYSTRSPYGPLSTFSGRGPRIDGKMISDITAPGDYDVVSMRSKNEVGNTVGAYRDFGGTSAAGPHVAGAAALLLQYNPWLDNASVERTIRRNARTDEFTGVVPNNEWGYGKLDVFAALPAGEPPPRPPENLKAELSGAGWSSVTLSWTLSPDDGAGMGNVDFYGLYVKASYDPAGTGYQLLSVEPKGTRTFVHVNAGEGNGSNLFYMICAGNSTWGSDCQMGQAGKFTHQLAEGPNLISIPLVQSNESIEAVLRTAKYDMAWHYSREWKWLMKHKNYRRDLWTINHTNGLWINVTGPSNLTVAGVVPAQTKIQLRAGWNMVSFPSFSNYTVADLKMETGAKRIEGMETRPPLRPWRLRILGDAEVLQAGYGYWVNVDMKTVWTVSV